MNYSELKRRIANPGEACCHDNRDAICNEFGPIAFVHADCEQDAFDEAADRGKLDGHLMADSDRMEYEEKGWDDSFILAGNASEAYWCEYLSIAEC